MITKNFEDTMSSVAIVNYRNWLRCFTPLSFGVPCKLWCCTSVYIFQCSQDLGSFPHPIGNQNLNSIDDSPVISSSNGIINQSDDIVSTTQTSPDQSALSERVKLERSPPLPRSGNERFTEPPSTVSA